MRERLLFELILTNQCNKRCPYCKIDFRDNIISWQTTASFINFIKNSLSHTDYIHINFFWWEPLLEFSILQYIISCLPEKKIKYSVGTNGLLLDKNKLTYLSDHNVDIYLSIDTETGNNILEKDYIKEFHKHIQINFIINPLTLSDSYTLIDKVFSFYFSQVNIMPVFSTIKWSEQDLIDLKKFLQYVHSIKEKQSVRKFRYYNGFSAEKQFVIDTDGSVYQDLDSLLWIQKQNNTLHKLLKEKIEKETYIGNIWDITFSKLTEAYSENKILKSVYSIPLKQWLLASYKVLDTFMAER